MKRTLTNLIFLSLFGITTAYAQTEPDGPGDDNVTPTNPGGPDDDDDDCDGENESSESIYYSLNIGTARYEAVSNFVAQDIANRMPRFQGYQPPIVDPQPFAESMKSKWGMEQERPVIIALVSAEINDTAFTPAALELYGGNAGNSWVKKDANDALRQIRTTQYLTDITTTGGVNDSTTTITVYYRSTIGALDSTTGLYSVTGAKKARESMIKRPVSQTVTTGYKALDILSTDLRSSQASPKIRGYRWEIKDGVAAPLGDTILSRYGGDPSASAMPYSKETLEKISLENLDNGFQRVRTLKEDTTLGGLVTKSEVREKYIDLGEGIKRIVERVEAPGTPEELTTTWTYSDLTGTGVVGVTGVIQAPNPEATNNLFIGARMKSMQRSDGHWEEFDYQYNANTRMMLTEKWTVWKNSPMGDRANSRRTMITLEENKRTIIDEIAGQIVSNTYETLNIINGQRILREIRQTGDGAPLITEHGYFSFAEYDPRKGRLQYTRHSDGTLTKYNYFHAPNAGMKTIIEKGSAGAAQFAPTATGPVPALTEGTRSERITNVFDHVIDEKFVDIASGLVTSQSIAVTTDDIGRPTHVIHDNDTDDFELFTYACCGLANHRARDGSVTIYQRDALVRPTITVTTLGSRTTTTTHGYGTETVGGRELPHTAISLEVTADGASQSRLVSETVTNLRREMVISRTADSNGDTTSEETVTSRDVATRTTSVTGPDGVTTTTTRYADEQPYSMIRTVGVTAISPLTTYDYHPHSEQGGGIRTTVTMEDTATSTVLSGAILFADMGGRTFRTEAPGHDGSTLVTATTFDNRGRAVGESSTGKPATLRVLNLRGEPVEIWTDSNGDEQFDNTPIEGIRDSVTLLTRDHVTEDGYTAERSRQWVRDDANQDILLGTSYRATNGTWSKTVPLTGPVTITTASKPLNGIANSSTTTYLTATDAVETVQSRTLGADGKISVVEQTLDTADATITTRTVVMDLLDRTISVSDGRTPATTYGEFTASGTPRKVTMGDGTYSVTTLDAASRPEKVDTYDSEDALIATVQTRYDALGRVTANWGTNTIPTFRIYDIQGRLEELRTYRSKDLTIVPTAATTGYDATTWDYEKATGLLLAKRDAAVKGADYTYTPDGRLLTRRWARGVVTTYGYDSANRLDSVTYTNDPAATPGVTMTYDRLNRKATESNGIASTTYTYDPATLLPDAEEITYNLPGFAPVARILDRSHVLGRDSGWTLKTNGTPAVTENQVAYTYSTTTGRFESVVSPAGTFTYGYEPGSANLIATITRPFIHTVINHWEDNRDVLDLKENKVAGVAVSSFDYSVNELGQRESVATSGSAFPSLPGWIWGYDSLGQVASADHSGNNNFDRGYVYDSIGNRRGVRDGAVGVPVSENGDITPGHGTLGYTANTLNQYTEANGVSLPATPNDLDGNLRFDGGVNRDSEPREYFWDAENRLIEVLNTSVTLVTYAYDVQSRRIATTTATGTTLHLYDAWNVIAEYSCTPLPAASTTLAKTCTWGLDLSGTLQGAGGVGGLLAVTLSSAPSAPSYYPTFDGNGNVSEYLDMAGDVKAHFEYDPFGRILAVAPLPTEDAAVKATLTHRFSTKPQDSVTGWYYYGYRYYDPVTGRWPSRDPIEEEGGVNLYGFVGNSVVNHTDYLGNIMQPLTYYRYVQVTIQYSCQASDDIPAIFAVCCSSEIKTASASAFYTYRPPPSGTGITEEKDSIIANKALLNTQRRSENDCNKNIICKEVWLEGSATINFH